MSLYKKLSIYYLVILQSEIILNIFIYLFPYNIIKMDISVYFLFFR